MARKMRGRAVEQHYWLNREGEETEMARQSASPEARSVHEELAVRYGARARTSGSDAPGEVGISKVLADRGTASDFGSSRASDAINEVRRSEA